MAPSWTPLEHRVVGRFVASLRAGYGADVRAVWLYGSRARGEPPREYSDVDLVVLVAGGRRERVRIDRMLWDAAEAEAANPFAFSVLVESPEWPDRRREIRDFFIAEIDRDRVEVG